MSLVAKPRWPLGPVRQRETRLGRASSSRTWRAESSSRRQFSAPSEDSDRLRPPAPTTLPYVIGGAPSADAGKGRSRQAEFDHEEVTQHFGGALTTFVFGAALLSERLNGEGIVQNLELHNSGFHPLLLASIAMLLGAAAWPEKRELGNPSVLVRLQMAAARVAYLGLAGSIAAEMFTGKGVLRLLDFETGIEALSDVEAVIAFIVMLFLTGPLTRTVK